MAKKGTQIVGKPKRSKRMKHILTWKTYTTNSMKEKEVKNKTGKIQGCGNRR